MIEVLVHYDKNKQIRKIEARGHAGYAEAGSDIVCSAVTALMAGGITGLIDVLGLDPKYLLEEGHLLVQLDEKSLSTSPEAQIIMKTTYLGIKQLEANYATYLRVKS